jgi:hypothetical protein
MSAQRDCLDQAARLVADLPGPVLELGLGNGRTYDHMREHMPDREIFVFDRQINAHPDCIPDDEHLLLGDIDKTLPQAARRLGRTAVLAHSDIGTGDEEANRALARWLGPALADLLAPGAVVVSDQRFHVEGWQLLPLPDGVPENRYFMYRVG